jgi:hypothetical protein
MGPGRPRPGRNSTCIKWPKNARRPPGPARRPPGGRPSEEPAPRAGYPPDGGAGPATTGYHGSLPGARGAEGGAVPHRAAPLGVDSPVRVIADFRPGKQVVDGEPRPTSPRRVVAVPPSEVDAFLGVGTVAERVRHLRGLRDLGLLVTPGRRPRLTVAVRTGRVDARGYAEKRRAYVFAVDSPAEVPKAKPRERRRGVSEW